MTKAFLSTAIAILGLLLLLLSASAVQLTPAAKSLDYAEGLSYDLRVINDQNQELSVTLAAEGLDLSPSSFILQSGEAERRVTITFSGSEADLLPGRNNFKVFMSAAPGKEGQFGAAVTLIHNLNLYRAYEGAYVEGRLDVDESDGVATMTLGLENKGGAATSADAEAVLREEHLDMGTLDLAGNSVGKLSGSLPVVRGLNPLQVTYIYDDPLEGMKEETLEESVVVGAPEVSITGLPSSLQAETVRIPVTATLDWSDPVDVVATVNLLSGDAVIATDRSADTLLVPGEALVIPTFLEIEDVAVGSYVLEVRITDTAGLLLGDERFAVDVTAVPANEGTLPEAPAQSFLLFIIAVILVLLAVIIIKWRKK